jgi:hypothetical protein
MLVAQHGKGVGVLVASVLGLMLGLVGLIIAIAMISTNRIAPKLLFGALLFVGSSIAGIFRGASSIAKTRRSRRELDELGALPTARVVDGE